MNSAIIGIDIGTTNVKAALFDMQGNLLCNASYPYPTTRPKPGWAEQQPEDWYGSVVQSLRTILSSPGVDRNQIAALCVTGHIRTIAFLDSSFATLYPGIVWSDLRSKDIADKLAADYGDLIGGITANRPASNYSLPSILWMKRNLPEQYKRTRFLATPKDYVVKQLTGAFVSDPSNQAGSLLLDVNRKKWSDKLLSEFQISKETLPELRCSTDLAGYITDRAAKDTGLPTGLPVYLGGGDNDTAALGAGVAAPHTLSVSLGTAGIILTPLEKPLRPVLGQLDLFPHVDSDHWYVMGMVKSAGFALEWLRDRLEGETLRNYNITTDRNWFAGLETGMYGDLAGNNDLVCLPYFQGRGNPNKDAEATGVFFGLSSAHTNRHILRSAMEGVGFCIRECVDALYHLASVEEIVCCGGGSKSPVWMQMLADILEKPVAVNKGGCEGALGCAIIASVGMGAYANVQTACKAMVRYCQDYLPHQQQFQKYRETYSIFRQLSDVFQKGDWYHAGTHDAIPKQ